MIKGDASLNVVHLTSSQFFGGPERQMLGLALALPPDYRSVFVSFAEEGRCHAFLGVAQRHGFESVALKHDTPRLLAAWKEVVVLLRRLGADVLCCHGYKANIVGRLAARRVGIPVLAISRGWTGEKLRVRCYDMLDRLNLRWMDRVVCVSEAQADRVLRTGVPAPRVGVIRNAIRPERFEKPDPTYRERLRGFFPFSPARIIGAAGRLSPEKGFEVLIEAAAQVVSRASSVGFVLFGDGPLHRALARQIKAAGLHDTFILAGFHGDFDRYVPFFDLFVQSSFTEGLPNVVLEAFASAVPVVATAVGGTPEIVDDGVNGFLVPARDDRILAERILDVLSSESRRRKMGLEGHRRVREDFTFSAQGKQYQQLFQELASIAPGCSVQHRANTFVRAAG